MKRILILLAGLGVFLSFQACNAPKNDGNESSEENIYKDRNEGSRYNMDEKDTMVPLPEEEDSIDLDSLEATQPVMP